MQHRVLAARHCIITIWADHLVQAWHTQSILYSRQRMLQATVCSTRCLLGHCVCRIHD
jgi:hypothetical protein